MVFVFSMFCSALISNCKTTPVKTFDSMFNVLHKQSNSIKKIELITGLVQNIKSSNYNFDDFLCMMNRNSQAIAISFTETWLNDDVQQVCFIEKISAN